MNEKAKKLLETLGTEYAEKGVDYKGYEVYIPSYSGDACIGLPLVVLVKGDEARISSADEALEYLAMTASD